jgi:ferredoxin
MHDDGLAYVKEASDKTGLDEDGNPKLQMSSGMATVPDDLLEAVIESADECPGECIFIEVD